MYSCLFSQRCSESQTEEDIEVYARNVCFRNKNMMTNGTGVSQAVRFRDGTLPSSSTSV